MWGGELVTWVTLTGVEGVPCSDTAASGPSSAESVEESGNLVARADLRGETEALGEAGAGEAEADRDTGVEAFVTDSDLLVTIRNNLIENENSQQ